MEPLRAAVIGCGLLGEIHARELHEKPQVRLIAVADQVPERAELVAAKYSCKAYTDYRILVERESPDLVVVATPDAFHKQPIVFCASAGVRHIVTEKPLATTVEDAQQILAITRDRSSTLHVLFGNRFDQMDIATRLAVHSGLIGTPLYGEAFLDDNISVPLGLWGSKSLDWVKATSPAHFLLSHVVDIFLWYLFPLRIEGVYAISHTGVLKVSPDYYDAFLFFERDIKVRIKSEWIKRMEPLVEFNLRIEGDRGTIFYNKLPGFNQAKGWLLESDAAPEHLSSLQSELSARRIPSSLVLRDESARNRTALRIDVNENWCALAMIVDSILENSPEPSKWRGLGPVPSGEDGLMATKVVCAIEESARRRREVSIA